MNIFMLQNIVGLLRHAAESLPSLRQVALEVADELKRSECVVWLEAASSVFEEAVALTGDPIYVTGTYWASQALAQVSPMQRQAQAELEAHALALSPLSCLPGCLCQDEMGDEIWEEAVAGLLELLERCRRGASLEQALALFPLRGDESAPLGREAIGW